MDLQKKGVMYVYKLAAGNKLPEVDSPVTTKKAAVVATRGLWGMRKSRTYGENEHGGRRLVAEGGGREVVEGRKSVSHVETNAVAAAVFLQAKVLVADMPGFMQVHAMRCARTSYDSLEKISSKHIAYNLKKEFDKMYGPAWHCIVGSSFGSFVTHSTGCFLYFSMEKLHILIFKTKVQRALD
ncbi:hypothetical protein U1Q18_028452 [Sarracenia purpurea var. burkii]